MKTMEEQINDLLWDFDNGHLNPYELVKKIKEVIKE